MVTCENDVVLYAHGLLLRLEDEQQTKGSTMTESTGETPVLDLLASMTADSVAASSLDPEALMLVRIAALAAVDAPAVSYLLNLAAAREVGINAEQVRGVLAAIAPIVGTARVASATGKIVDALDVAIEVAELEEQDEQDEM
jgi:4-carboxymuconolactone decarboxylase